MIGNTETAQYQAGIKRGLDTGTRKGHILDGKCSQEKLGGNVV
jgi:hypothetical protein